MTDGIIAADLADELIARGVWRPPAAPPLPEEDLEPRRLEVFKTSGLLRDWATYFLDGVKLLEIVNDSQSADFTSKLSLMCYEASGATRLDFVKWIAPQSYWGQVVRVDDDNRAVWPIAISVNHGSPPRSFIGAMTIIADVGVEVLN